jgi:hypothetical protein
MENTDTDCSFAISTKVSRHCDFPEMLILEVFAETADDIVSDAASLHAQVVFTGFGFPDMSHYHLFDCMSAHAQDACNLLVEKKHQKKIMNLMRISAYSEPPSAYILIDEITVTKKFRGRTLALRLLREAISVFGYGDTLVILKAHPTSEHDVKDADIRGLADYYLSDSQIGFKELDRDKQLGWLIAYGAAPFYLYDSIEGPYYG